MPAALPALSPSFVLRNAVAAAVMAPSSHNSQPWRFRLIGERLELWADRARHLTVIDAERRQQIQSCGCALYNARVAIRAMGYEDDVRVHLDGEDVPLHLATIELGARIEPSPQDAELLKAVALRRTNRRPFLPRPVGVDITDALEAIAAIEGATLIRLEPEQKRALGQLVAHADEQQFADPGFRDELAQWLAPVGSRRRDGIPFVEKEYGNHALFGKLRVLRSPGLGGSFGTMEDALVRGAPAVIALGTTHDTPRAWLTCGQALEAILLHATSLGLSAAFLNQCLEIASLRERVRELIPQVGYPHMVLRLGIPESPVEHAAPRRDLDDVLEVIE